MFVVLFILKFLGCRAQLKSTFNTEPGNNFGLSRQKKIRQTSSVMSSINTQPIASSGKYVTDSKRAKIRKRSQARENRQPIASARKYVRTRGHEWFGFTFDWSIKQDDSPDWLEVHRKAREVKSRKRLLHLIVFRITCESTLVSRNNFTEDNLTGVKIESELCPQHVTHQFAINN